jgi:hypothetical protein
MVRAIYQCEICGVQHKTLAAATKCENQPLIVLDGIEVGDMVTTDSDEYGRFGWHDGDDAWVMMKSVGLHGPNEFARSLIYIVTAIQKSGIGSHRARYHVETKGMVCEYRGGYTEIGHMRLRKVNDQKLLSELDGSDLIGHKFRELL